MKNQVHSTLAISRREIKKTLTHLYQIIDIYKTMNRTERNPKLILHNIENISRLNARRVKLEKTSIQLRRMIAHNCQLVEQENV